MGRAITRLLVPTLLATLALPAAEPQPISSLTISDGARLIQRWDASLYAKLWKERAPNAQALPGFVPPTSLAPLVKAVRPGVVNIATRNEDTKRAGHYTNEFTFTLPEGLPQGVYPIKTTLILNGEENKTINNDLQLVLEVNSTGQI